VNARRRRHLPKIGAIVANKRLTDIERRVLSPSAALDRRGATLTTPDPDLNDHVAARHQPVRKRANSGRHLT
jgi:hypothetical protein